MINKIQAIPNSPQEKFLKSNIREVGYGGQAGGAKSFSLILDALYQLHKPNYNAILFRRTYKRLKAADGLIDLSKQVYPCLGGKYNQSDYVWTFPQYHNNTIRFSHMEHEKNAEDMSGPQYAYVGFDELQEFSERMYLFLFSRNRSSNPDVNVYMRSTFNPGGVGHFWLKQRFITTGIEFNPKHFLRVDGIDTVSDSSEPMATQRMFIPSRLEDNPYLYRGGNSDYERGLHQLGMVDFKRLRHGDWDIRRQGRVYHQFSDDNIVSYDSIDFDNLRASYYHAHDFGAVNRAWGLYHYLDGVYTKIYDELVAEGTTATRAAHILSHLEGKRIVTGYGGAASETQQRQDYADAGLYIEQPPIPDVESQIDAVNKMFENGSLKICSDCTLTINQLENCVRDEKEGIADKATWHHCFVAGTLISTELGLKSIEDIRIGDKVKTRNGFQRVINFSKIDNQPVMRLKTKNNLSVTGTGNHPIFTSVNNSTRLDELRYSDIIIVDENYQQELYQWQQEKIKRQLNLMVRRIIDTCKRTINQTENILGIRENIFIGWFGSIIMGLYQKDFIFIIRIIIRVIMIYVILKSFILVNTLESFICQLDYILKGYKIGWKQLGRLLKSGMHLKRVRSGIVSTLKMYGKMQNILQEVVISVGSTTKLEPCRITQSFAQAIVKVPIADNPVSMMKLGSANIVVKNLRQINMGGKDFAKGNVLLLQVKRKEAVYNLTVENDHEYFANGILVSNCDEMRYFCSSVYTMGEGLEMLRI